MSAALARDGHEVQLFARCEGANTAETVQTPQGYTLVNVSAGPRKPIAESKALTFMGPFARYLDAAWAADPPDIAHAHDWVTGIATQLATRDLGLPSVQTLAGVPAAPEEHAHLEATVAKAADWVTATCTDDVIALTRMGRPRARISVVPCGVDTDLFTPDGAADSKDAEHRIVCVADSLHGNEIDSVVRCVPMVPKAELLIVGTAEPGLLDTAASLGVARRVHLCGAVTRQDLPSLLRSADVVVTNDPSGVGALEAMACGVPVVAQAFAALDDIIVDNVTGRLVPAHDPRRLAVSINVLLRDSFLRRSFGAAGRDRAHARYSWDRIAGDMVRIYDRLAQTHDSRMSTSA
ncbi:glycosyltransferase [Mycolicibacterium moriokaense]|nr:glycosyltransferase [Mycolicibacterium moriokaense]